MDRSDHDDALDTAIDNGDDHIDGSYQHHPLQVLEVRVKSLTQLTHVEVCFGIEFHFIQYLEPTKNILSFVESAHPC